MSVKSNFSRELRRARRRRGLTQERAANALSISTRWFQEIENGRVLPSAELTLRLIAFFAIDGAELCADEGEERREEPQTV